MTATPVVVEPVVSARPTVKRWTTTVDWAVLVLGIVIVIGLVWLAYFAEPAQVANVTPQLAPSPYTSLFVATAPGPADPASVPLQVTGTLNESANFVTVVELDTRPSGESRWQPQPACCTILGSSSMGSSFTGSARLPVASTPAFDFQLVSGGGDNTILATGTLAVHLDSYPEGSQLALDIVGGLGLIAALQPWRLMAGHRTADEPPQSQAR